MTLTKLAEDLFVPEDFEKNHYYYADEKGEKKYTGVSSILSTVYAKPYLLKWAANMAVDFIATAQSLDKQILDDARTAYAKRAKVSADFGTDAHAEAEKIIKNAIENKGGKVDALDLKHDSPQVRNLVKWAITEDVIFLESEKRLYSKEMWLAGTCDFVCEIKGKKYVGDLKTSKQISYDYHLQTAAYSLMLPYEIHGTVIVRTGKGGKVFDVKTRKYSEVDPSDDFEVEFRYDMEGDQKAFRNALSLYRSRADYGEDI